MNVQQFKWTKNGFSEFLVIMFAYAEASNGVSEKKEIISVAQMKCLPGYQAKCLGRPCQQSCMTEIRSYILFSAKVVNVNVATPGSQVEV